MSPDEIEKTFFPKFWKGVQKNHVNNQQNFQMVGFDTETCFGQVFAMGFFNRSTGQYQQFYGERRNFFRDLLESLFTLPNQHKSTIVAAAHYLPFDLSVLLWKTINPRGYKRQRAPKQLNFSLIEPRCTIFAVMGKPCFMKIKRDHVTYHVIDTFSFFGTSLEKALETIGGKVQKLKKPKDLGKRIIPEAEVTPYLRADCEGVAELLNHVIDLHKEYKARLCVSLPMLAGRIFRHKYMRKDFVRLPAPVLMGSLFSYHGGKNTFVGEPGWYKNVYDLDIRSAFPEAMRQLPNFEDGEWFETRDLDVALKNKHGVYRISGFAKKCKWGVIFNHEFRKIEGRFSEIWITGYELQESIRCREVIIDRISGYFFIDNNGKSAFKQFVDDFYKLKETAENKIQRQFFKLILNSLYGKFIQRNEKDDGTKEAGAMFDPAVASLITGYVRAQIHALEHKYMSLHTATDGLLTRRKPDPNDLGEGLGKLKQENYGNCLIIRNKLYLHYDSRGNLFKRGLHGYQGNAEELLKLWKLKKSDYKVDHLVKWSEAWHIGLPPGFPITKNMRLNYANSKR